MAWLLAVPSQGARRCPEFAQISDLSISDGLRLAMGIGTGFHTSLRVEEKATSTPGQADAFLRTVRSNLGPGETLELRDRPSERSRALVTSTNYMFSRAVQQAMNARIRVREYGEREKGTKDRFTSSSGNFVNLEVKAKTDREGVVVKPILRLQKGYLKKLFKDLTTFTKEKSEVQRKLEEDNPGVNPEVIAEVLSTIGLFHEKTLAMNEPMSCYNIEYQRQAYELTTYRNGDSGFGKHKVQLTFDRAVELREGVDPTVSPYQASAREATVKYPDGRRRQKGVVVVEMKSDLAIDETYRTEPELVRKHNPTYFVVRRAYETLQLKPADGFQSGPGKASQLLNYDPENP